MFLRTLAAPMAATALTAALMIGAATLPAPAQEPKREITNITGDVWRFQNNFHTSVFVVTAAGVVVTDPIPEHMSYLHGTAIGDGTKVTFSVDRGRSFDQAANLRVRGKDGAPRTATPDDYTHIRWKFTQELPPGASRLVRFRARLQ